MKYLFMILCFTNMGCSYNWSGAKIGDTVIVTDGFFKGCIGVAADFHTWVGPCQYQIYVEFFDGPCKGSSRYVSSCDLKVEK